jgi:hypothetical protein
MRRLLLPLLLLATTATAAGRFSFTYVYKSGDQSHLRSNGGDIDTLVKTSKRWKGEFVWLQREGREYLIRDAGVLSAVAAAFAEMHAFEPRLRAAEEKRRPIEAKMEVVEERLDRLTDEDGDERARRAAERELQAIEGQHRVAEREAEKLEAEMDRLEAVAERKFEQIVLKAIEAGKAQRL